MWLLVGKFMLCVVERPTVLVQRITQKMFVNSKDNLTCQEKVTACQKDLVLCETATSRSVFDSLAILTVAVMQKDSRAFVLFCEQANIQNHQGSICECQTWQHPWGDRWVWSLSDSALNFITNCIFLKIFFSEVRSHGGPLEVWIILHKYNLKSIVL